MPKLLQQVSDLMRQRHYSPRTEHAYIYWIKRYILFHQKRHPINLGAHEATAFLSHLARAGQVSSSTQNQALAALLFLYRDVLRQPLPWLDAIERAKRPQHVPVVFTETEVQQILAHLSGTPRLMAQLLYGAGLRLMECLRLRVKDIDFEYRQITVRDGKGGKDRLTILPDCAIQPLRLHLRRVKALHEMDLQEGYGRVSLPSALARKYPQAEREWGWQYVFPSARRSPDRLTGVMRRFHTADSVLQKAIKQAIRKGGITKAGSCHTLRHSFATHLLAAGYDIRTIQELMGHKDVGTTMIYTHVLHRGGKGVRSPIDANEESINGRSPALAIDHAQAALCPGKYFAP